MAKEGYSDSSIEIDQSSVDKSSGDSQDANCPSPIFEWVYSSGDEYVSGSDIVASSTEETSSDELDEEALEGIGRCTSMFPQKKFSEEIVPDETSSSATNVKHKKVSATSMLALPANDSQGKENVEVASKKSTAGSGAIQETDCKRKSKVEVTAGKRKRGSKK